MSVTTPLQPSDNGADSLAIINGNFTAVEQLVADEVLDLRNNDINAVQGDISTIQGDISTIQGDISTIQGDISTIEGDISTINGTIGGIQSDITDLDEALEATINDGAPLATTVVKGRSKLSVAPVDEDEPIAIGDNDPRVTELVSTSSGASDEGKVAKLNASGQIPEGFFAPFSQGLLVNFLGTVSTIASDNAKVATTTSVTKGSDDFQKYAQVNINHTITGVRVKATITRNISGTVEWSVRKNGSSISSGTGLTVNTNITSQVFDSGDTIEIWAKYSGSGGADISVTAFSVNYDWSIANLNGIPLQTPLQVQSSYTGLDTPVHTITTF
jgi:hypothetical protein